MWDSTGVKWFLIWVGIMIFIAAVGMFMSL
jgi:hypothetical protein